MSIQLEDTIAAIGTAAGNALRGVLRISGSNAIVALKYLISPEDYSLLKNIRSAEILTCDLHLSQEITLPADLYVWPDNRSYTKEPSLEIHTLGNRALLDHLLSELLKSDVRLAEPGEFTMRAFLAGRLDLSQAEAVLGVIDANGSEQLETALSQLAGGLSKPLEQAREQLIESLALLEAGLDFAEEDIEFVSQQQIKEQIIIVQSEIEQLLTKMELRDSKDQLQTVVLVGLPNAGKSSLFNALVGDNQAIVSEVKGTTRDYLTATIVDHQFRYRLVDTAGVEEQDSIESIRNSAQVMTQNQQDDSDLILLCQAQDQFETTHFQSLKYGSHCLEVITKADLQHHINAPFGAIFTSVKSGQGLTKLREEILLRLIDSTKQKQTIVAGTVVRCRLSLQDAQSHLTQANEAIDHSLGEEIIAAELRLALTEIGKVAGTVYTDDLLDVIFSRFCIGK